MRGSLASIDRSDHRTVGSREEERNAGVPSVRRIRALHELVNFKRWPLFVISCAVYSYSLSFSLPICVFGIDTFIARLGTHLKYLESSIVVSHVATSSCALVAY